MTFTEKKAWVTWLRIAATLAVIWMHVNGTVLARPEIYNVTEEAGSWFLVNYYLMKWAVPVFIMITGALLLDPNRQVTWKDALFKYARRPFLDILIFGSVYAFVILLSEGPFEVSYLYRSVLGAFTGKTSSHLWYLFLLIGLYLVLPVVKSFIAQASRGSLLYIIIVLGIMDLVVPFISNLTGTNIDFEVAFTYGLFYLFCGYYLLETKVSKWVWLALSLLLTLIIGLMAYWHPVLYYEPLDYKSPVIAIYAITIYGFFMSTIKKADSKAIWKLDRLCFGVYLIHPIFIQGLYRVVGISPMSVSIYQLGTLVVFLGIVVVSYLFAFIMHFIPVLRKYLL